MSSLYLSAEYPFINKLSGTGLLKNEDVKPADIFNYIERPCTVTREDQKNLLHGKYLLTILAACTIFHIVMSIDIIRPVLIYESTV